MVAKLTAVWIFVSTFFTRNFFAHYLLYGRSTPNSKRKLSNSVPRATPISKPLMPEVTITVCTNSTTWFNGWRRVVGSKRLANSAWLSNITTAVNEMLRRLPARDEWFSHRRIV